MLCQSVHMDKPQVKRFAGEFAPSKLVSARRRPLLIQLLETITEEEIDDLEATTAPLSTTHLPPHNADYADHDEGLACKRGLVASVSLMCSTITRDLRTDSPLWTRTGIFLWNGSSGGGPRNCSTSPLPHPRAWPLSWPALFGTSSEVHKGHFIGRVLQSRVRDT